ncbi:MAG: PEP-CTERM sorting domain-containing protein [Phycisphaeraceae bacterium]
MKKFTTHTAAGLAVATALVAGSTSAQAELLVYEGFDYDTALTELDGEATNATGLSGNWSQRHTGAGESDIVAGLSLGSLVTSGNAFMLADRISTSGDRYNVADATISASTNENTIWHSHLVQLEVRDESAEFNSSNPNFRWQSRVSVHEGTHSRTDAPTEFGFSATKDGSSSEGRIQMGGGNTDGGAALNFYETYLVVAKLTGLHDASVGATKTADMWVLSASDFSALEAANFTEAALDSNSQYKLSRSVTNDEEIALTGQLNIHTLDWTEQNFTPIFDEVRFGTSLTSVTPIPEPASLALMGVGGALMLMRRRSQMTRSIA